MQIHHNLVLTVPELVQSSNRINVALSRAKHGLYILGNASNLRKNETWRTVLDEMENEDQVGFAFPIICPRHPEAKRFVSKPGELPTLSPEGGCLQPCDFRLMCGHVCPSMVYKPLFFCYFAKPMGFS